GPCARFLRASAGTKYLKSRRSGEGQATNFPARCFAELPAEATRAHGRDQARWWEADCLIRRSADRRGGGDACHDALKRSQLLRRGVGFEHRSAGVEECAGKVRSGR